LKKLTSTKMEGKTKKGAAIRIVDEKKESLM
jgi:hypothetical protein